MPKPDDLLALIVDDDALIRMDAADILVDAGFSTQEAVNAVEALELPETIAGDVLLEGQIEFRNISQVRLRRRRDACGLLR